MTRWHRPTTGTATERDKLLEQARSLGPQVETARQQMLELAAQRQHLLLELYDRGMSIRQLAGALELSELLGLADGVGSARPRSTRGLGLDDQLQPWAVTASDPRPTRWGLALFSPRSTRRRGHQNPRSPSAACPRLKPLQDLPTLCRLATSGTQVHAGAVAHTSSGRRERPMHHHGSCIAQSPLLRNQAV